MAMDLSPNGGSIVSGGGGNILARTVLKSEIKVPSHKQETVSPTPSVSSALTGIMKMSVANEIQDHKNIVGMQSVFLEDQDSFLLPSKGAVWHT